MKSQHGAYAWHAGLARLHARMHMSIRLGNHMHAPTHKHAHTDEYVVCTYCFSTATMVL
jgi:hypothetical protein